MAVPKANISNKKNTDEMSTHKYKKKTTIAASKAIHKVSKNWEAIDPTKFKQLPQFDRNELYLGKLLGQGGFNKVVEIVLIRTANNEFDNTDALKENTYSLKCLRHGFIGW